MLLGSRIRPRRSGSALIKPSNDSIENDLEAASVTMKKRSWLQSLMYRFARRAILFELTNVFVYEHEARPAKRCRKDAKQTGRYRVWRLSPEEIVRFAADDRLELSSNLADRLENGSYCYGLAAGDQLICYAWFATREIEPEHNSGCDPRTGIGLKLNPDTSFVYKGYTHPDYRSRGLITRALCFALDDLAKQGVDEIRLHHRLDELAGRTRAVPHGLPKGGPYHDLSLSEQTPPALLDPPRRSIRNHPVLNRLPRRPASAWRLANRARLKNNASDAMS